MTAFSSNQEYNVEAEYELISACCKDNSLVDQLRLQPEDFGDLACRELYRVMKDLAEKGDDFDAVILSEYVSQTGPVAKAGGLVFIAEIIQNTLGLPQKANAYAKIVRHYSQTRRLDETGRKISSIAKRKHSDISDLRAEAELLVSNAIASEDDEERTGEIGDLFEDYISEVEERHSRSCDGKAKGAPTGLDDLDEAIGGLNTGELIVIGARPSMGKTALIAGVAKAVASCKSSALGEGEHGVVLFSQEMKTISMLDRFVASSGSICLPNLIRGELSEDDFDRLAVALGQLNELPLWINDESAITLSTVRREIKRLKAAGRKPKLIIIDYLQLMSTMGLGETRNVQVGALSRGLKAIAKQEDVAIIALSQLSRKLEERQDKRPIMADLRESGEIEQDADLIMFIYRDEVYRPNTDSKGVAEIIIGKFRNGPTGTVKAMFVSQYARFDNVPREYC